MTNQEKYNFVYMIDGMNEAITEINTFVMTKETTAEKRQKLFDKKRLYSSVFEFLQKCYDEKKNENLQMTLEGTDGKDG